MPIVVWLKTQEEESEPHVRTLVTWCHPVYFLVLQLTLSPCQEDKRWVTEKRTPHTKETSTLQHSSTTSKQRHSIFDAQWSHFWREAGNLDLYPDSRFLNTEQRISWLVQLLTTILEPLHYSNKVYMKDGTEISGLNK